MAIKKTAHTTGSSTKNLEKQLHQASDQVESKIDHAAEVIEEKMDEVASSLTKTVNEKIDPQMKKKAHDVVDTIDDVATKVEDVVTEIWSFIPHSKATWSGSDATLNIWYTESTSRLTIFRLLWLIVQWPIIYIWSIWASLLWIVYTIYILILSKREKTLWSKLTRFMRHTTKRYSYIFWLTDKQPKIIED